jgi:hypothetical protein
VVNSRNLTPDFDEKVFKIRCQEPQKAVKKRIIKGSSLAKPLF